MSSFSCKKCGAAFEMEIPAVVNADSNPEIKEKVVSGELFVRQCPVCGELNLVTPDFLYTEPSRKLVVCLTQRSLSAAEDIPDTTCRLVGSVGELIEKIKISDASLSDVVVEMCKYVTLQEMGRDLDLKFLRLEGADNDLVMAYPQDGQMQMLQLGFNVYEDCLAIVSRNPEFSRLSSGLVRIDRKWMEAFFNN